jgi:hypothetical protein
MRLLLVFLLLLKVDQDTADALLVLLPLVCLCAGLGLGVVMGHEGMLFQFKNHMDKHFLSDTPDADCRFCKLERPVRA